MMSFNSSNIKLSGIEPLSSVDGTGLRYAIFVQGCSHNCYNCHNPETHDYFNGGYYKPIQELLDDIDKYDNLISGITLTGGDPLYIHNVNRVASICQEYKRRHPDKTIWLYTGFTYEAIYNFLDYNNVLDYVDVLVDGPFIDDLKSLELSFKGSSNQRIIDMNKTRESGNIVLYEL